MINRIAVYPKLVFSNDSERNKIALSLYTSKDEHLDFALSNEIIFNVVDTPTTFSKDFTEPKSPFQTIASKKRQGGIYVSMEGCMLTAHFQPDPTKKGTTIEIFEVEDPSGEIYLSINDWRNTISFRDLEFTPQPVVNKA